MTPPPLFDAAQYLLTGICRRFEGRMKEVVG